MLLYLLLIRGYSCSTASSRCSSQSTDECSVVLDRDAIAAEALNWSVVAVNAADAAAVRVLMLTTNSHIGKHRATVHTHSLTQFNCNNSALAREKICTSTTHRARRQNKQLRQRQLLFSFARFLSLAPLDLWPPLGSHQRRLHSQASQATRRGRSRRRRRPRRRACQCF